MAEQSIEGDRNVQIQGVVGSRIQITYGETTRSVPLEPAHVPVGEKLASPARLVRAHSGVVPYIDRAGLIDHLESWAESTVPFLGHVIGGPGGAGKTRLAVQLCQQLEQKHWLCGFLIRIADQGMLDALVEAPVPRLVVIDYAETRPEQLELLLPLLSAKASPDCPVRVLLLVRDSDESDGGWATRLANRVDALDAVLDECEIRRLEDSPFEIEERYALFEAAVPALAERFGTGSESADPPDLSQEAFAIPLMVVVAACLAALGEDAPATQEALLQEVLAHERRHWRDGVEELDLDDVLLERVVALATMMNAATEAEAEAHLTLLPSFSDSPAERRNRIARWVRAQYPGPRWWNPLEPDLVGEYLVARCFSDQPEVLRAVLAITDPVQITRPLEVFARAAANHSKLALTLAAILDEMLEPLCRVAIDQAEVMRDSDLLYGKEMSVAAAIGALIGVLELDVATLARADDLLPPRPDLVLDELGMALNTLLVERLRLMAEADAAFLPDLANGLNNLSNYLATTGRSDQAVAAAEESVRLRRPLIEADPGHRADLARALNNLSNHLSMVGDHKGALEAGEESVELRRAIAAVDPSFLVPLARGLSNLTGELAAAGRHAEALAAIEEAVEHYRPLADANADFAPELSTVLNNLSNRLAEAGREAEALLAIEESVQLCRLLAASYPAAYAPDLAKSLNNLSNRLAAAGRRPEAFQAVREAIAIFRPLAEVNPAAHAGELERVMQTLALRVGEEAEGEGAPDGGI